MNDSEEEQSRASRQKVFLAAKVSGFGSAASSQHRVKDLSATGACIDGAAGLRPGATVLISVGALEAVAATVVWSKEGVAGLEFAEAIDTDAARSRTVVKGSKAEAIARQNHLDHQAVLSGWMAELNSPYRKRD